MLPVPTASELQLSFKKQMAAKQYQLILDAASGIEFNRENIGQDLLAPVSKLLADLKDLKDEMKRPYLDANDTINDMFNSLKAPLEQILKEKSAQKAQIATQLEHERRQADEARMRVNTIVSSMNDFVINVTNFCKAAKEPEDLVKLERRIGTELSRKAFYAEFYDDFAAKMSSLRQLIAQQKTVVRELSTISEQKAAAIDAGEMSEAMEHIEALEEVSGKLESMQSELMVAAFSATSSIESYVPEHNAPEVKPKRTEMRYRVSDINKLQKNHPQLVSLIVNEVAAKEFLRVNKKYLGEKDDEKDFGGIVIFKNKKY